MNINEPESETAYHVAPLDLRPLEIDKQGGFQTGSLEVIEALSKMFFREAIDTFELHHKAVLDDNVREVLSDAEPLVRNGVGDLTPRREPTCRQLADHSALVNPFQKPAPQRIRDLVGSPDRDLNQFTFINGL